jgi:hypothetical protein
MEAGVDSGFFLRIQETRRDAYAYPQSLLPIQKGRRLLIATPACLKARIGVPAHLFPLVLLMQ